jgi:quinol monooxygenase YgiN
VIVVHVEAKIDPAEEEHARAAALVMQEATQAEPGNLAYRFSQAVDDPTTVLVFEVWQDQAAVDAHSASEHMATFMASLAETIAGPVVVTQYDAEVSSSYTL